MKKITFFLAFGLTGVLVLAFTHRSYNGSDGFSNGSPEIKSITSLAFGPDGILFIGDSRSAVVFAMDTKDAVRVEKAAAIEIKNV